MAHMRSLLPWQSVLAGGCVFVVIGAVAAARRTARLWSYSAVDSPPAV